MNVVDIAQVLSALAAVVTVLISYLAIRQVNRITEVEALRNQKRATLDALGDKDIGIAPLSKAAYTARQAEYPYTTWSDVELNQRIPDCSHADLRNLNRRIPPRLSSIAEPRLELAKLVTHHDLSPPNNYHTANSYLFNRIEHISTAIEANLYNFDQLNVMFGNMILYIYEDHSEWLADIKRKEGPRAFDHSDQLIDRLIHSSSEEFDTRRLRLILIAVFQGLRGWSFIWRYAFGRENQSLDDRHSILQKVLEFNLDPILEEVLDKSRVPPHEIEGPHRTSYIRSIGTKNRIAALYSQALEESDGTWPADISLLDCKKRFSDAADWVNCLDSTVDWMFFARSRGNFKPLVGAIGVTSPSKTSEREEYLEKSLLSAARHLRLDGERAYLTKIGFPTKTLNDGWQMNFEKLSVISVLYVAPSHRFPNRKSRIGRRLLRRAISFCRYELGTVPVLSVYGDATFTERAVALCVKEGGAYLGSNVEDGTGKLLHWFIF